MDERARVLELFRTLPALNFDDNAFPTLTYIEPKLQRPLGIVRSYKESLNNSKPLHPVLEDLKNCLKLGVSKLEYGRTSIADWHQYFRFSSDSLNKTKDGNFYVCRKAHAASNEEPQHKYVNRSAADTNHWFLNTLLPLVKNKPRSHVFLLGDPGAGKSTLIKYLINTHQIALFQRNLIFSRFEFMKFINQWHREDNQDLSTELTDYLSFILLRDIVHSHAYAHGDTGLTKKSDGPFSTIGATTTLLLEVGKYLSVDNDDSIRASELIDRAITPDGLNVALLRSVPMSVRVSLIGHFSRTFRFVLVMDGLDCIAFEDQAFETERVRILQHLIRTRTRLTNFVAADGSDVIVEPAVIFVMRENTFYFHRDREYLDVSYSHQVLFWVQNLSPRVAIHNAVTRGVMTWADANDVDETRAHEIISAIMDAVIRTTRFINHAIGAGARPDHVLNLFAGNLRLLFEFLQSLLGWFIQDALQSNNLDLNMLQDVESVLKVMTGRPGFYILRRRKYRIIETLLFSGLPWFENAIVARKKSNLMKVLSPTPPASDRLLSDNELHTGFVDNVFNYHVHAHENDRDRHSLLEKIRIIQLVSEKSLTEADLENELLQRFGYSSPELSLTLTMMIRTQLLRVEWGTDDTIFLRATDRGLLVVNCLSRTMAYMEHVFHRTLLPVKLVESINDPARSHPIDAWTAASIRNVFVFLTYLKHVENNKARGKSVPPRFRIFDKTHQAVMRSIGRMLAAPPAREGDGVRRWREDVAADARKKISSLLYNWERQGILASAKPDGGEVAATA